MRSIPNSYRLTVWLSGWCLGALTASAAPLAWFPGPSADPPFSGAATLTTPSLGNVLIGGDAYAYYYYPLTYPLSLTVTNSYWNYLAPLYSLNLAPGAVAGGGMIILYGGTDGTSSTNGVIGYEPSGDTPLALAPMSVARSYLGYAPDANGRAYAIGGLDDRGNPLASAECYNPDTDTWSPIAPLPTPRYDFPAVFNRTNQIYIFGGRNTSGAEIATVLRYSVSANTWTALAPMPVATAGSAAALGVGGKIYVAGGVSGGVTIDVVQVYDPTANSWIISTPLPEALSGSAMGVDSLGRLIVMGGRDANGNDVGDVWRSQQLNAPDSAPVFTQYPGTNATCLTQYVSSINATGSPPPTYVVLSGPTNLTVDFYSGAITWTPQGLDQIGMIPVAIRATNFAGHADWNFTITVPNPPPPPVTNLAVVGVTENSVTLSWAPADPVAGPVSYSVWLRHVLHDPRGSGATIWYTQIGSNASSTTTTITGLTPGLTQTYYVIATGPGGSSGYAGISATTLSVQPPVNLRITGLTSTSISLAWDPPSGPVSAVSFEIWGWVDFGISTVSSSFGKGITATAFTVTGLAPGSSHNWAVRAYDAEGYISSFAFFNKGYLVYNPVPGPVPLSVPTLAADGSLQISAAGAVNRTVQVWATSNLADPSSWTLLTSCMPTNGVFSFTDTNAGSFNTRFYQVIGP